MGSHLVLISVILSFLILIINGRVRFGYTLLVTLLIGVTSSIPASEVLFSGQPWEYRESGLSGFLNLRIDSLSAFFVLVTNFTVLTGLIYSHGYLSDYRRRKHQAQFALHYFSYSMLHLSMLLVIMLQDGYPFLMAWELMAVSSFMLILFEAEKRTTLKTAVNYLIQMHLGLVCLLIGFLLAEAETGVMTFDSLGTYFSAHNNTGLFFLFFAGFAVKAGFVPLHIWLPQAHPAAPSHVSGVMSGVMIKMGIYGIFRVILNLHDNYLTIGLILLAISSVTALWGILQSITRTDIKQILACSTIENVGIIGIGAGIGVTGIGTGNPLMALMGFTGSLYHVLNHSLFKSLLFFSSGSVYKATHTRNIEELGGLIKPMPFTSGFFLLGATAISALPPLNGFISEFILYTGILSGIAEPDVYISIAFMLLLVVMVVTGGLAIFSFSRVFGVTFLGLSRRPVVIAPGNVTSGMMFAKVAISLMIVLAGLVPLIFLEPISRIIPLPFPAGEMLVPYTQVFLRISLISLILIALIAGFYFLRNHLVNQKDNTSGPTWGCGYTAAGARHQYTATSFTGNLAGLAHPLLQPEETFERPKEEDIFPDKRTFSLRFRDIPEILTNRIASIGMSGLKRLARLQTGNIQHYVLYAFLFILFLFGLMYFNIL